MIQVVFDRGKCSVVVLGHAGAGEPGKDLVCAGVSALCYTLAANVGQMVRRGWVRKAHTELKSGRAVVCCEPKEKCRGRVGLCLEAVCEGFFLLAQAYPAFVRYRVEG